MMCTKYICFLIYFSRAGRFLYFKMLQCVHLWKTVKWKNFFFSKWLTVLTEQYKNKPIYMNLMTFALTYTKPPFIYTDKTVVCMLVMLAIHALAHIPITCHLACQQQSMALPLIFTILQNVTFCYIYNTTTHEFEHIPGIYKRTPNLGNHAKCSNQQNIHESN